MRRNRNTESSNLRPSVAEQANRLGRAERAIAQREALRVPDPDDVADEDDVAVEDDDVRGDDNMEDNGGFCFSGWKARNIGTESVFFQAIIAGVTVSVSPQTNKISVHFAGATHTYLIREPRTSANSEKVTSEAFDMPLTGVLAKAVSCAVDMLKEQSTRFKTDARHILNNGLDN